MAAALIGGSAGLVLAGLLLLVIQNTPVQLPPDRMFWQLLLLGLGGGLAGLAIESIRELQQASPESEYHHRQRLGRRPSQAPPPPERQDPPRDP
ncbi:MAG TPA: hypothetical protein DDY43_12975 [Synechococcales bacterium UBA10510]|nr:hypothetical protein [Synechococcales bacterium UBA10510]